tara:strand:+ start:484 stop:1002 length:519 start_codon:yes stop_codon:yes gene_type:complete
MRCVIDDALPIEDYKNLEYLVHGSDIQWRLHNGTVGKPTNFGDWRFTHIIYHQQYSLNEKYKHNFNSVFNYLKVAALISCKLNCDIYTIKPEQRPWHVDQGVHSNCTFTSILYFNDCNGKTMFKDDFSVKSKRNRMVIFNSELEHCGVTQTDAPRRYVLNTNFISDPNNWKN